MAVMGEGRRDREEGSSRPEVTPGAPESSGDRNAGIGTCRMPIGRTEVSWLRANVMGPDQAVWALRITARDRYSDRCWGWGEPLALHSKALRIAWKALERCNEAGHISEGTERYAYVAAPQAVLSTQDCSASPKHRSGLGKDSSSWFFASAANLTDRTRTFSVMPAKAGTQGGQYRVRRAGPPPFRGGDEKEKFGLICLVRTTSRGLVYYFRASVHRTSRKGRIAAIVA